jgi:exopolysaccharide production protein ExoZ
MAGMERGKLPGIQVGRAIAAIAVFYFHSHIALGYFDQQALHTFSWLAARGAGGVELFFTISGFIVCYVAGRPDFSPRGFLLKRFLRIYPLNALVTIAIVVIVLNGIAIADRFSLADAIGSVLIIPQQKPINSVGWTLEFEIMFYLLSAIIIPVGGTRLLLLYCLTAGTLGIWLEPKSPPIDRLVNVHYFEFGAGIAAYFLFERLTRSSEVQSWILSWLFIVVGILFYIFGPEVTRFYVAPSCLLTVIGLALLPWAPDWLVKLGDISYGVYLFHWPVLCLIPGAVRLVQPDPSMGELWRWLAFLCVWIIASLSWTFFERPINRLASGARQPSPAIVRP